MERYFIVNIQIIKKIEEIQYDLISTIDNNEVCFMCLLYIRVNSQVFLDQVQVLIKLFIGEVDVIQPKEWMYLL